jgi:hypothetical protein
MNEETQRVYDRLHDYLKDSIPILRKTVDIDLLPTLRRYYIEKDNNRVKIVPHDQPNWWQTRISEQEQILTLSSLQEAIDALNRHQQIRFHNGKYSIAFGHATRFYANNIPRSFLKELINRENALIFRKKSFEALFNDFLKYISTGDKSYARLVVPFDNLIIDSRVVELEDDLRIRKIAPEKLVDLVNNCPVLGYFYGRALHPWFQCMLEFDIPFNWSWVTESEGDNRDFDLSLMKSSNQDLPFRHKINQEIVILRAILNRQISAPTFFIDYRGWDSVMFTGGTINHLPWARERFPFHDPISSKELKNYKNYRQKFLKIKDEKTRQRIFVAMRKLAFSMDKPYGGDQLMDTVSGLEGLLVNSKTEVTHKFAERVAILLENDHKKRENLQKDMREAYNLRSDVAHGSIIADDVDTIFSKINRGQQPKKEMDQYNKVQQMRTMTRKLLHKALLVCIDNEKTEFNWDSALMGTKTSPLQS